MKIAFWHFYTFRMLRGIETLIISLANALVQRGADVSIVTAKPNREPLVLPDKQVKVYAYPTADYFSHISIVPYYLYHFLCHQYDHVVVFFADFGEGTTWRILNPIKEMQLTLYLCYSFSAVPHRYRSFLKLGWERKAKHIFADANWFAGEAARVLHRPIEVVPIGTDPDRFRPDPLLRQQRRQLLGFTDRNIVLLSVSALERRKGVRRVIQAMSRLRNVFTELRYVILGEGDDELNLRRLVDDLDLRQEVIFAGTTTQLEAYYNMADIFAIVPDAEANSIASHEALSCELPLIVSNTGGFVESIPGTCAFLVNPDSTRSIDAALGKLVADQHLRRRMGQAGRSHILNHLTWDRVAKQYLELVA